MVTGGDFILTANIGVDGNMILNQCGVEIPAGDTLIVRFDTACFNVGINENSIKSELNVYPNPSRSGDFNVRVSGNHQTYNLIVLDVMGREVYTRIVDTGIYSLNSNLTKGLYMVLIKSVDGKVEDIRKLIVQ